MRDLQYMIDVMTAAKNGNKIHCRTLDSRHPDWSDGEFNPCWNWVDYDYCISHETRKAREFVLHEVHGHFEVCDRPRCNSGLPSIRVREVLPK